MLYDKFGSIKMMPHILILVTDINQYADNLPDIHQQQRMCIHAWR